MTNETKYEDLAEICQRIIERIMAEDELEERMLRYSHQIVIDQTVV
jgi:hypothetical protein